MSSHLPDLFRHQKDFLQIINFSLGQFLEAGMKSWTIIKMLSYVQRTMLGVNASQTKKKKKKRKNHYQQYKENTKGHYKLMILSNYSCTFTCLVFHLKFLLII